MNYEILQYINLVSKQQVVGISNSTSVFHRVCIFSFSNYIFIDNQHLTNIYPVSR